MDQHASENKETQEILGNLSHAIGKLVIRFSAQLGQESVDALNTEIP